MHEQEHAQNLVLGSYRDCAEQECRLAASHVKALVRAAYLIASDYSRKLLIPA